MVLESCKKSASIPAHRENQIQCALFACLRPQGQAAREVVKNVQTAESAAQAGLVDQVKVFGQAFAQRHGRARGCGV